MCLRPSKRLVDTKRWMQLVIKSRCPGEESEGRVVCVRRRKERLLTEVAYGEGEYALTDLQRDKISEIEGF